jgi:hypothetical protein
VDQEGHGQHQGAKLVKEKNCSEATHSFGQAARPDALAETQRQSRGGEPQKAGEERGMKVSPA